MPESEPRQRLLDDILSDDAFLARRQQLLAEAGRCLRQRRRIQFFRRALVPLAASLALALALGRWWPTQGTTSSTPGAIAANPARRPATEIIVPRPTPEIIFITTADVFRSPTLSFAEFSTQQVPLNLSVIPDQELLALFADRGALLLSQGESEELWLLRQGRLQAVN